MFHFESMPSVNLGNCSVFHSQSKFSSRQIDFHRSKRECESAKSLIDLLGVDPEQEIGRKRENCTLILIFRKYGREVWLSMSHDIPSMMTAIIRHYSSGRLLSSSLSSLRH